MLTAELNQDLLPASTRISTRELEAVLKKIAGAVKANGHLSVAFVTGPTMRRLNMSYRGKDKVTDVLAFPYDEKPLPDERPLIGEVLICYPEAKRQAKEHGRTVRQEVGDLLIHGILHVLGYDHERPVDARKMFPLQEKIYQVLYE